MVLAQPRSNRLTKPRPLGERYRVQIRMRQGAGKRAQGLAQPRGGKLIGRLLRARRLQGLLQQGAALSQQVWQAGSQTGAAVAGDLTLEILELRPGGAMEIRGVASQWDQYGQALPAEEDREDRAASRELIRQTEQRGGFAGARFATQQDGSASAQQALDRELLALRLVAGSQALDSRW